MEPGTLDPAGRALLAAVVGGPVAWQTPAELAGALGWPLDALQGQVATLDAQGYLQVWERGSGGLDVTLTPWATERLGVRLAEYGSEGVPRWIELGQVEPRPRRKKIPHFTSLHLDNSDDSDEAPPKRSFENKPCDPVDPAPGPLEELERAEYLTERERRGFRFDQAAPWPHILLGLSLTPWPGPRVDPDRACPACGERRLAWSAYCLYCDRWGLDGIFPTVRPSLARPAEDLRASRKAKRRARFAGRSSGRPVRCPGVD